jgi:phytoene/squalene synthetase
LPVLLEKMSLQPKTGLALAEAITKAGSKQAYYSIRYLANRKRTGDAYLAYAYFRWVDDVIDAQPEMKCDKTEFIDRQQALLEACYRGETPGQLCDEERMLVDLVQHDTVENSGLQSYLRNMMGVMLFDSRRCGRLINQVELADYTHMLATAATEAMFYFYGGDEPTLVNANRYLAVTAAHITHILRDTFEDNAAGLFNIPLEYLEEHKITPYDVESQSYQEWVYNRVQLARQYFNLGREFLSQVQSWQCRLAGYAYVSRFEWVLDAIERDHFILRPDYSDRKSLPAGLRMGWSTLGSMFASFP